MTTSIESPIVLDAEPLLAYLDDEPGADTVERMIEDVRDERIDAFVSYVTLCEVAYVAERALDAATVQGYVETLLDYGIEPVDLETVWYPAARFKNDYDLPLGDAIMLATARQRDATAVVGADGDFDAVPDELIVRFRSDAA